MKSVKCFNITGLSSIFMLCYRQLLPRLSVMTLSIKRMINQSPRLIMNQAVELSNQVLNEAFNNFPTTQEQRSV